MMMMIIIIMPIIMSEFSRAGRRAYLNLFIPFHSVLSMR